MISFKQHIQEAMGVIRDKDYRIIGYVGGKMIRDKNYNIIGYIDADIVRDQNYNIIGYVDDAADKKEIAKGVIVGNTK